MDSAPPLPRDEWLCFGAFEFSAARRELRRDGRLVEVGQRGLDLLAALLADAGQPVPKARLMHAAWGGRTVEHSNLTVQIAALRQHLGAIPDDPTGTPFIRTVPGYGYVFAAPVTRGGRAEDQARKPGGPSQPKPATAAGLGWLAEPLTLFIGRDKERRALARLLAAGNRLVTVTGMGGVGKTRLVMRLRHEVASAYADGVTFVDLAPLAGAQVEEAVACAVGAGGGEAEAEAALVKALQGRRLLLVLDNAEHLGAQVARLLGRVLALCPLVSVLVTSRDSLGVPGEAVFRLSPLDLAPEGGTLTTADAIGYDSVRLFVDRAAALLPGFELDDGDAPHVAEICRRLDGIALAIEMAVPRLEVLTVRQLAERLQDRFGTVAGPRHDVPPRQRTLRAMFDWSWDLLSEQQRRLLQLLAIPAAGTTLATLEALAAADGLVVPAATGSEVVEQLTRLAQSSLVIATLPRRGGAAEPRYRLLETTRQYALERLPPERRTALDRLYAQTVAALFERADAEWPVTRGAEWLGRYGGDADNLRAAMQWASGRPGDKELALRLAAASFPLWWELPGLPLREARTWYALALAGVGPETPPRVEARLWLGLSWTDTFDNDVENFPAADQAMRLFRAAGDPVGLGAALWRAASTVLYRDHAPSAPVLLQEALRVLAGQPASKWRALCQVREADLLQAEGALLPALSKYDQAMATMRELEYGYGLMVCGGNRSYALFQLGRHDEAVDFLRSLGPELPLGLRHPLLSLLATMLAALGQDGEARALALEGLGGTVTIGMEATLARSVEALALVAARSGDRAAAARLLGFVLVRHPPGRARLGPRRVVYEQLDALLGKLPAAERAALQDEGASWTEDEAVAAVTAAFASAVHRSRRFPTG